MIHRAACVQIICPPIHMTTCPPDLQLTVWWLVLPVFHHCFAVFDNLCYQATCHSATCCQCVTPSFSIAISTCKARKLHQYFIGGSILLRTDSMGKEINSGVLIMQCGDTDLILCLSTCTDILMHSAPLLSSTQEVFTLFVQSLEKKKDTSCLTEVTSLPKPPKDINKNAGATCWFFGYSVEIHIFIFTETMWMLSVGLTTGVDSWADALKVNCERLWQGTKKAVQQPLLHCTMGKIPSSQEKSVSLSSGHLYK